MDRLRDVRVPLQGIALPVDVWERDVLPRRVGAYSPSWMDQLCASGEVVWVGAGSSRHLAALAPAELVRLTRGEPVDVVQEAAYDASSREREEG